MMIYIVNYDIKDSERKDAFLNEAKNVGETIQFLPHGMFICGQNTNQNDIYSRLKKITSEEDLFIVTETSLSKMSGWLTSSVVDWLNNHK